jgi:hypothetical protein
MFRGTPEEIAALKVGDTLYNFDGNRRTYRPGLGSGGPIYEKHFEAVKIEGETKQSWVMARYGAKVNKKTLDSKTEFADRGYFTKSAMEADIWMHEHQHKIVREVERAGLEQLREIARIIGYDAGVAHT